MFFTGGNELFPICILAGGRKMSIELVHALTQLEKEKGVNKEVLIEAIEAALISAYKKNFGSADNIKIYIDRLTGDVKVFAMKTVKESVEDGHTEIEIDEARKINDEVEEHDVIEVEVTPGRFGRIAAQTAKQVVMQRIREAERGIIFEEFFNKESDIVTGIVQRTQRKDIIVDLGKTEGFLTYNEQVPGETYEFNERIKVYVIEVKKSTRGPRILVSRTHPGLVKRLFELEVPEIHEGVVEVRGVAREAGSRTKIAVYSKDDNVDPVGACVGQKGIRVQAVVDELRGEKIDIIRWSSNPQEFISSSLSPAKVIRVITNEEEKAAKVIVPDFQLSLAIGKEGQNARLAAKLTGWKVDIKSESQLRADIEQQLLNYDENYIEDEDEAEEEDEYEDTELIEEQETDEYMDEEEIDEEEKEEIETDELVEGEYEEVDEDEYKGFEAEDEKDDKENMDEETVDNRDDGKVEDEKNTFA
jgi:transcription termination/antitermination protein NusA